MSKRKGSELENLIAKKLNTHPTFNSGALFGDGDVFTEKFCIECKDWNTDSFSIKYNVWKKIQREAHQECKDPLMICRNKSKEILVTMDLNTLLELLE